MPPAFWEFSQYDIKDCNFITDKLALLVAANCKSKQEISTSFRPFYLVLILTYVLKTTKESSYKQLENAGREYFNQNVHGW